ncbi:MAG: chemotaxis protein CheX [Planctomycetota bacterium]|jgi:CheY-specific phosphatase CheX
MSTTQPHSDHAFRVEYIQPFLNSLHGLFAEHLAGTITVGKPCINPSGTPPYEVSGVISFTGSVIGRAVVSFPMDVAIKVVKAYLEMDELPEGLLEDCVGELANVIVGRAKSDLETYQVIISPPTVITGGTYQIAPQRGAACVSVPCETSFGRVQLDISVVKAASGQAA